MTKILMGSLARPFERSRIAPGLRRFAPPNLDLAHRAEPVRTSRRTGRSLITRVRSYLRASGAGFVFLPLALFFTLAPVFLAGCGSGGGAAKPPAQTPPPPPPPPPPTFEERLAEWSDKEPRPCRANTPGFEALGGWIKDSGKSGKSRVWIWDDDPLTNPSETDPSAPRVTGHGSLVWSVYSDCTAAETSTDRYFYKLSEENKERMERGEIVLEAPSNKSHTSMYRAIAADGRDAIESISSTHPGFDAGLFREWTPEVTPAFSFPGSEDIPPDNSMAYNAEYDGQRILRVQSTGNTQGEDNESVYSLYSRDWEKALWIGVGGWGEKRTLEDGTPGSWWPRDPRKEYEEGGPGPQNPFVKSNKCTPMEMLCVVAPFGIFHREITNRKADGKYYFRNPEDNTLTDRVNDSGATGASPGTSFSAPHVAAALDSIWVVWPDMDILDLRNLAFDCAKNMPPEEGETATEYTFSYTNGRQFTSRTTPTWGHGIFDVECLFTPNGGLQNPTTGEAVAGGIFGPVQGAIASAFLASVDYTGRDFGYGFARPVAQENFALLANANLSGENFGTAAHKTLLQGKNGLIRLDLTAAGNALGASASLASRGGLILRAGLAIQPEGAGSLSGSRSFRAPSTLSATASAAWSAGLPVTAFTGSDLSFHIQADHWRTLTARGRSLWQDAQLQESRLSASLVKRIGKHELSLVALWQSGIHGALQVNEKNWNVDGVENRGAQLVWRMQAPEL